jgi:hypothetical protein
LDERAIKPSEGLRRPLSDAKATIVRRGSDDEGARVTRCTSTMSSEQQLLLASSNVARDWCARTFFLASLCHRSLYFLQLSPGSSSLPPFVLLQLGRLPDRRLVRAAATLPGQQGVRFPDEKHSTLSEVLCINWKSHGAIQRTKDRAI